MKLISNLKASFYSWKIWDASIEGNWKVSTELGSVKFLVTLQLVVSLDSVYNRRGDNSKQVANDLRVTGNKWRWKLQMWSSLWHGLVKSRELEWWLGRGKQFRKKKKEKEKKNTFKLHLYCFSVHEIIPLPENWITLILIFPSPLWLSW